MKKRDIPFDKKQISPYLRVVKKIILVFTIFILCSFDWTPKDNSVLRHEMISFSIRFSAYCDSLVKSDIPSGQKPRKASGILHRLIKEQQRDTDPYRWIHAVHSAVEELKLIYPPHAGNDEMRSWILRLLDYPLHVDNYMKDADPNMLEAYYSSTSGYLCSAKEKVLKWIDTPCTDNILSLKKLYNMGFIFRTADHTVGIDITDRHCLPEGYQAWNDEDYTALASRLDILLLTHPHSDHYSLTLLQAVYDAGKTLILPCPISGLKYENDGRVIILDSDTDSTITAAGCQITAFHGNQGENIPCNIYLMDIGGHRIIHNGDNYDRTKEARLNRYPAAEVIIGSSWNNIQSLLSNCPEGASSRVFIPAHENEICHTVNHRESYRELFTGRDRLGNPDFHYPPTTVLDNGEGLDIMTNKQP